MPRIITGSARGIHLAVPKGTAIRPTSDRAKEALFSKIGVRIVGASVLDLFAGSGQIALEALSRGAEEAVLVERHRAALAAIRENIARTRFEARAVVMPGDARTIAERLRRDGATFDLIYCDPPWSTADEKIASFFSILPDLCAPEGLIVTESGKTHPSPLFDDLGLTLAERCTYGMTVLSFYHPTRRDHA